MGNQKRRVTLTIRNFPDEKLIWTRGQTVAPLDMFYWHGLGHYICGQEHVSIDTKKVYVSPEDAAFLYRVTMQYILQTHGGENLDVVTHKVWKQIGPRIACELRKGKLGLETGYLSLV